MIVFKTFLKVMNKTKASIIMYTVFLVIFSTFNMQANENTVDFVAEKPDVAVVYDGERTGLAGHLIGYFEENANIKDIKEENLEDALFYRDVNYIIYLGENFNRDFERGDTPKIEVKSTGDYQSSLASMMLSRYMEVATTYRKVTSDNDKIFSYIDETLKEKVDIQMTTKLDTNNLSKMGSYYNFTNYCILAGAIYIISLVLAIFKDTKIDKRTIISSMDYKKYNRQLLIANSLFSVALWLVYVLISCVVIGSAMFSTHGLFYILNSFIFTLCALSIAFLIGNIVRNKEAINGIVNVIALGSSFLCGAFVPMDWLPSGVLKIAHILPSYWFIEANELIKTVETFDRASVMPIFVDMAVVLGFTFLFIVVTNVISKRKRKIA